METWECGECRAPVEIHLGKKLGTPYYTCEKCGFRGRAPLKSKAATSMLGALKE